ncbi:hypothetical protein [Vibrio hyugaensis]|uniref:hypothetical protein n=1 Tax=Vibrio hyugaensis TaxID=1534743 RepID=UPI000CE4DC12|nr:hypothetical protein [Vibrio hyugaensis]
MRSTWVITVTTICLLGTANLSAQPQVKPVVKPITQPGNKHDLRPVNRPHRPSKPPHYHRPPYYRPPYYHRPPYVARPPHNHSSFIFVRPGYWYPPYRGRYYYYHSDLVGIATFAIFSGITYAIVQDSYYRRNGDRYDYVRYPPSGNYTIVNGNSVTTSSSTASNYAPPSGQIVSSSPSSSSAHVAQVAPAPEPSPYKLGEIVNSLPHTKETVVVDGQSYFKYNNTWFAPLREERKFVVVESPL